MPSRKLPPDAFELYFSLGLERSYQAVAEHYGCSKTAVSKAARRDNWQGKIVEREKKAHEANQEKAIETLQDLNARHLKMLRTIQGKALEGLRSLPLSTGMDCVRALDLAIKGERLVLGEPTERTAADIETVIRREHQRWLIREPGDRDDHANRQGQSVS